MPADLRTRLKALVEEWQESPLSRSYAHALAAILAESEPERECSPGVPYIPARTSGDAWSLEPAKAKLPLPLGHEFVECTEPLMSGEVRPMGSSRCKLCGRKRDAHVPLGHAFVPCDCLPRFKECQLFVKDDRCHEGFSTFCGQPRSAHEVKP